MEQITSQIPCNVKQINALCFLIKYMQLCRSILPDSNIFESFGVLLGCLGQDAIASTFCSLKEIRHICNVICREVQISLLHLGNMYLILGDDPLTKLVN